MIKWIKRINFWCLIPVMIIYKKYYRRNEKTVNGTSDKHFKMFLLMNQWVRQKKQGVLIEKILLKRGFKEVAIYGVGYIGDTLLEELRESAVDVKYCIDRNADGIYLEIPVVKLDDDMPKVDAIIVTAIGAYDEIKKALSQKIDYPIISLESLVYDG